MKDFERWVILNYRGKEMDGPPPGFDPTKEIYYKIDHKYYGPILIRDIPSLFLDDFNEK